MPDEKKDKPKQSKSKKKSKVDIPTIIFFSILIIGAIVLTFILLKKPHSKLYSKSYGSNIETIVEVYNNNEIDMAILVEDERTVMQGTYKAIGKESTDTYNGEYEVTFKEGNSDLIINMTINDDTLILTYDDGTTVELKERK